MQNIYQKTIIQIMHFLQKSQYHLVNYKKYDIIHEIQYIVNILPMMQDIEPHVCIYYIKERRKRKMSKVRIKIKSTAQITSDGRLKIRTSTSNGNSTKTTTKSIKIK